MAYSVTSVTAEGLDPGYFAVYMGTAPEKVPEARAAIVRELELLRAEPPGPAEMERARRYLVGTREISLITEREAVSV
jgi:zinc protease